MEGPGESTVFRTLDREQTMTVLLVDDDRDYLDATRRALERRRPALTIETETNPKAALDRVEAGAPIDCVVTDYRMPARDGLRLLERVREHDPEMPVLLLTGRGSESIAAATEQQTTKIEDISEDVDDMDALDVQSDL